MNPSTAPENNSFAAGNREFEKSHAGMENIENTENKKGFLGSYLVNPIKNAVRYIADGIRAAFRNIRSFLISVCSPVGSCFRGEKNADPVRRDVSSRQVESHEQSAVAEPAPQDYPITLPGQVKLVSSQQGIGGFIRSRPFEKPYGVVNSIDKSGKLLHGVGCAIKELAGDGYARATREKQCSENLSDRLGYGQCTTCNPALERWKEPEDSGGKNWRAIHNVLVPFSDNPKFETHLKNSLLAIFEESVRGETAHIVLPLLGCGRAGGTGEQLAQALFAAAREFQSSHLYHQPPEMVLVGTESSEDRQALAAFESKWRALNQHAASSQPAADPTPSSRTHQPYESTPSDIGAGAVAEPVPSPSGVTPAASPSVSIPARAFSAGTDAMTWDDTGPAHQCGAALDEASPNVRSPSARPAAQEVDLPSGVTSAALPSASIPARAFSAGTDAMTRDDTGRAHQGGAASNQVDVAGDVTILPGDVKVIISNHGIEDFIKQKGSKMPYGVVNSIDRSGELRYGVGCVIGKLAGRDYARATRERQNARDSSVRLDYGECYTYDLARTLNKPPESDPKWVLIHNVLIPDVKNPDFVKHMKNSFLMILKAYAYSWTNETHCLVFPMLGCGRAGGSSDQLAQAIFDARREFVSEYPRRRLPEMILTSTASYSDRLACTGFADKWKALHNQQKVSGRSVTEPGPASRARQPDVSTPSDINSGAAVRRVCFSPTSRKAPAGLTSDVILKSRFPSGAAVKRVCSSPAFRKAPADPSSDVIPKSAFPAKAGEVPREYTGRGLQVKTALTKTAPRTQLPPARPGFQNAHESSQAKSAVRHSLMSKVVPPVTFVYDTDLRQFIESLEAEIREDGSFSYGVVSPVDASGDLQDGAARVVKDMVGARYAGQVKKTQDGPFGSAKCGDVFWFSLLSEDPPRRSSNLNGFHSVYCVPFPSASDPEFSGFLDDKLKEAISEVLFLAAENNIAKIVFPSLGCDKKTGGSGGQLAKALYGALYECRVRHPDKTLPKVFLLGADMDALVDECQIFKEFRDQWSACEHVFREQQGVREPALSDPSGARPGAVADVARTATEAETRASAEAAARASAETETRASAEAATNASTEAVTEVATSASAGAVTRVGQDDDQISQHKVLINGLLEVAMCSDKGMFGYGRKLSSEGKTFDLVNAANGYMAHGFGVAKQFEDDLGVRFRDDTKVRVDHFPDNELPAGQCITTESYAYASDPKFGLTGCQYIHSVVAPDKKRTPSAEYEDRFRDAFVSVLLAAAGRGSDTVVSCFIGCAIFNGDGGSMARALHAAYHDDRIKSLGKVPKLVLTGWDNPNVSDGKVYRDFVLFFEMLNEKNPVKLPSRG